MTAQESAIYNYRRAVTEAFARVFELATGEEAKVWTAYRNPDFQKARPRYEIVMDGGVAQGILLPVAGRPATSGMMPEKVRLCGCRISVITAPNVEAHDAWLTLAEFLIDTLAYRVRTVTSATGENLLPYHTVSTVRQSGFSGSYVAESDHWSTDLTLDVSVAVKDTAWQIIGL